MLEGTAGLMPPGEPGRGGSGMAGGGDGRAVAPIGGVDFRLEAEAEAAELERKREMAAASGDKESRL